MLPRLGRIKVRERASARLHGARIMAATVRYERGRWFVSFTVEQDVVRPDPTCPDVAVGVDLGIKTLAVVANDTGATFEVPDRRTRQEPSNRWRTADAARNRALGRVADQRGDGVHKLTTDLAATSGTVVVEDLHVAGMVKNRRLARHVADRWFASSKTCSGCGAVKAKLALSERTYVCEARGTVLDRDVNAAVSLARLAGSGPDSNGRGADPKTGLARQVAVKRQSGTRQRGQTGTLPPQGESAA